MNKISTMAHAPADLSPRDKVHLIEAEMAKAPSFGRTIAETEIERLELPVKHHFAHGSYARELFIPKGTLLTGEIHKYSQINIMSQGRMSLLTGDGWIEVTAPFTVVSPPGTKRIAFAHEDTVWTTIHGTNETDLEKIGQHFIAQSEQEYLEFCQAKLPEGTTKCLG